MAARSFEDVAFGEDLPDARPDVGMARVRRFTTAGIETIVPTEPEELLHRRLCVRDRWERFSIAETVAATTLSLPIHPTMTGEERRRVADVLATLGDLS